MSEETATLEAPAKGAESAATPPPDPNGIDSIFSELDQLDQPTPRPAPGKKVEKPAKADESPVDKTTEKVEDKAPEKPAEKPEEQKPVRAAELRTAYEKSKVTIKERDQQIQKLTAEIEQLKTATPPEDTEKKSLAEKVTAYEKRIAEYEQHMAMVDFKKTEVYQKNYWKPYEQAMLNAIRDLEDATYEDEKGDKVKVDQHVIQWLASQKPAQAELAAQKMFGELSGFVTRRIERIRETAQNMAQAEKEHAASAGEHAKQSQQSLLQERQKLHTAYTSESKAWQEKLPNWFKPRDGDTEGNDLLAKGYALVDQAFSGNGNLSPEARAKIHAQVALKAAAAPRLALDLKRARAKIKELETIVADYEQSEPPGGEGGKTRESGKAGGDLMGDALAEIDALERGR